METTTITTVIKNILKTTYGKKYLEALSTFNDLFVTNDADKQAIAEAIEARVAEVQNSPLHDYADEPSVDLKVLAGRLRQAVIAQDMRDPIWDAIAGVGGRMNEYVKMASETGIQFGTTATPDHEA